ncbi:MAG: hypothetical protein IJU94_03470 [Clostridia bacterium]|nr:hypothetical protein [Clostridia bacterium]
MTRDETIKLLAILKAAYPTAFRAMSRETAEAMLALWSDELAPYPSDVVTKAARRFIRRSKFMPCVSELLRQVWETAVDMRTFMLSSIAIGRYVPREELKRICDVAERLRHDGANARVLADASAVKRIEA